MYAYHLKLDYFSTECTYSPNGMKFNHYIKLIIHFILLYSTYLAYRGYARVFLKDLERVRESSILDIIYSGEQFEKKDKELDDKIGKVKKKKLIELGKCVKCGYISSMKLCKACVLLDGLNKGLPLLRIE